jgi:hypothetical protein
MMPKSKQTNSKTLKVKTSVKAGCYGCSNARRWVNGWLGGMP